MKKSEFADKIDKSSAFVSLLCSGQRRPGWDTAKVCADIVGNDPAWWMEATPEEIENTIKGAGE